MTKKRVTIYNGKNHKYLHIIMETIVKDTQFLEYIEKSMTTVSFLKCIMALNNL